MQAGGCSEALLSREASLLYDLCGAVGWNDIFRQAVSSGSEIWGWFHSRNF